MQNKLTEVQKCLVVDHLGLVYSTIHTRIRWNYHNPHYDYDDLYQIGCEALCIAAMHYKPPAPFPAYAKAVIRHRLLDYCSKANVWGECMSIEGPEGDGTEHLRDDSASLEESIEAQDMREMLRMIRNRYSGVARKGMDAIELKFSGYKGAEIAKLYGVRPNQVSAWVARARQRLVKDCDFLTANQAATILN